MGDSHNIVFDKHAALAVISIGFILVYLTYEIILCLKFELHTCTLLCKILKLISSCYDALDHLVELTSI